MATVHISSQFDAGSIEVVSQDDPRAITLRIRPDNAAEFAQWFYFSVQGPVGQALGLQWVNAGECAYPQGWEGYQVVASYDRLHWFRLPSEYDGQTLRTRVTLEYPQLYLAYFEPYSYEQYLDLLASAQQSPYVQLQRLGHTAQGRPLQLLRVSDAHSPVPEAQRKKVWLIARQHPGETMASWFVEGFLERLLDPDDALARQLRQQCVVWVAPHMNPDGAVLGNLRTNSVGCNLNRAWAAPTAEASPEVLCVRAAIQASGADVFLDVHGDEGLPYVFVVGTEGTPRYNEHRANQEAVFKAAWQACCPDFQDNQHYPRSPAGAANLGLATNWVAEQLDCLAFTIEMPFKDNADAPDALCGWSSSRSKQLGASVLQPMLAVL